MIRLINRTSVSGRLPAMNRTFQEESLDESLLICTQSFSALHNKKSNNPILMTDGTVFTTC